MWMLLTLMACEPKVRVFWEDIEGSGPDGSVVNGDVLDQGNVPPGETLLTNLTVILIQGDQLVVDDIDIGELDGVEVTHGSDDPRPYDEERDPQGGEIETVDEFRLTPVASDWSFDVYVDIVGDVDFTVQGSSIFPDEDGDGIPSDLDCDDGDAAVAPGAEELCDGLDNDCDLDVDEGNDFITYYPDEDEDGYGVDDPSRVLVQCEAELFGYATVDGDCDDNDASIHPGVPDDCDRVDDDCDLVVDEDSELFTYYADRDGDGYGDPNNFIVDCELFVEGYSADGSDCDDSDATVHPGADDRVDDSVDSDCDGLRCQTGTLDGARFGLCLSEFLVEEAQGICTIDFGGDLASIRSGAEQQLVRELMVDASMPYAVIGLSDVADEGSFVWLNGDALTYTNWGTGEPNNGDGGGGGELMFAATDGEDCGAIQGDRDYTWNDIPCDFVTDSAALCGTR